ncbi:MULTISPECIES: site-specific integrase [unclassified Methylobacterium]|uniref:site-specific integrase n=1 Tax=unclassified Methylobacterium TaxID=2615210 RepID=UPI0011C1F984|nr:MULTISPECIES: site-specific integrase [unclassified Methylobacterium]QEE40657.1 tyrosine-type recombinase/integrase [Methylobacterium sp. WL1]TXN58019.1 tyrosine-type recombinase/integrase [Methylobacterium sp. WL2]
MAKIRISKRTVDALEPGEKAYVVYDAELTGFGIRVAPASTKSPEGLKTFIVEYRPGAGGRTVRSVRLAIGRYGVVTPDDARRIARDKLAQARTGEDPAAQRRQDRGTPTVATVAEKWMAEQVAEKFSGKTKVLYRSYLVRHVLPAIGTKKLTLVTPGDIDAIHVSLGAAGKQPTANRLVSMLSAVFNFALRRRLTPAGFTNPVFGLERYREEKRERFLTTAELQRLGDVLRQAETTGLAWHPSPTGKTKHAPKPENRHEVYSPHVTGAIRLLLFTGCRLREILHLRWSEIDFERGFLFLPKSKTGAKTVVLNAPALDVLAALPHAGTFVIASGDPEKPRADLQRPWARITAAAGLDGLRIHDLRHSFASVGAGGGMGLPIVGKLLGHTNTSTTARYAHLHADPLRQASERIGRTIAAALDSRPPAEIISITDARKSA